MKFLQASGYNIFIHWPIYKLVLYVFVSVLFKDASLIDVVDSLTLELMANSTLTHAGMKLIQYSPEGTSQPSRT